MISAATSVDPVGAVVDRRLGLELVGAWRTAMVDDDECVLLWAAPTWAQWAAYEEAHEGDPELRTWIGRTRELVTRRHRIVLVDSPLSPMRTGRQPTVDDRTDWVD